MKPLVMQALSIALLSGCQIENPEQPQPLKAMSTSEVSSDSMVMPAPSQDTDLLLAGRNQATESVEEAIKNNSQQDPKTAAEPLLTVLKNPDKTLPQSVQQSEKNQVSVIGQHIIPPPHPLNSQEDSIPISAPVVHQKRLTVTAGGSGQLLDYHQASSQIQAFLNTLKDSTKIQSIHVTGHTDHIGSAHNNRILAQHRATAVQDILKEAGVNSGLIHTHSVGEDQPIADNHTASGRAKNRRVEIEWYTQDIIPQMTREDTDVNTARKDS